MQLTRKQSEAFNILATPGFSFLLYGGAIRGAKTVFLAVAFARLAMMYPNSRWAIMRADRPKITNNLLPAVNNMYNDPAIDRYIVARNKSDLTYTFFNGSVVQLFPESFNQDKDMSRFLGLEVNGFGLDELSEFQKQTLEMCFVRAGSWLNARRSATGRKPRPIVLGTCNPTKNWVKTEIYDKRDNLPEGHHYLQAKITDNPFVGRDYYNGLKKNMTKANYRKFVDGDWEYVESAGHEWLFEFNYTQHVKKVPYMPSLPTYLTYDFNVLPYMTLLCFQVEPMPEIGGYRIRFYDEFCLDFPRNSAKSVTQAWINKYPKVYGAVPVSYCGDASGENRVPGFGDKRAFNAVRETLHPYLHSSSNRVYKKQFFNEFAREFLNDLLSGHWPVEIVIDENLCPTFIQDLQDALEDQHGGINKVKGVEAKTGLIYEKVGHCTDAFKYGMLSVFSKIYEDKYHNAA